MIIIWRFVLLFILFFAALVCFPEYPANTVLSMFVAFIILFIAIMIISFVATVLLFGRSSAFNHLFDLLMVFLVAFCLLKFMPQTDGVSPLKKLLNGNYPNAVTIEKGIKKLDFRELSFEKEIKNTTEELNKQVENIEKIVTQEAHS